MQRWHTERFIMLRRWRQEWEIHGRDFGTCHCGLGMGTLRKHRPRESHPSSSCRLCARERFWARQARRRARYAARSFIEAGLSDESQSAQNTRDGLDHRPQRQALQGGRAPLRAP